MSDSSNEPAPIIRRATTRDLSQILELLAAASLPTVGVAESLSGFWIAASDGAVAGAAGVELCGERYALLRSIVVREDRRDRGLGARLVDRAIAAAESEGVEELYLLTTTAERYFPNFGFARVERADVPSPIRDTAEFSSACPASATVMRRRSDGGSRERAGERPGTAR